MQLVTVKEASKILKTNLGTTYDIINSGLLKSIKIGTLKTSVEWIDEFISKYEGKDISVIIDAKRKSLFPSNESS